MTNKTPISEGKFLTPGVALVTVDALAKFKERGFIQKRSRDPDYAPFGWNFFTLRMGLAVVDPLTCQI